MDDFVRMNVVAGETSHLAHSSSRGSVPRVCVVTSTKPRTLTKAFCLENGDLKKIAGGVLVAGRADIAEAANLKAFGNLIVSLKSNQALVYGLPPKSGVRLTTKAAWEETGHAPDTIPRIASIFAWNDGPAILMLDYDPEPGGPILSRTELVEALRRAVPGLSDAAMLWFPSASSHIVDKSTGEDLTGLRGQRIYIAVADARDIPRAGKAIIDRLWLAGYGFIKISKSGALLERTLFDGTVWQTNRLDFAAGAYCREPLEQRRGEPIYIAGQGTLVDTSSTIPALSSDEAERVAAIRTGARESCRVKAAEVKAAWVADRGRMIAGDDADTAALSAAENLARRAVEHATLYANFPIVVIENGLEKTVTVAEVLADRSRFGGMLTLDPLEPDYDGRRSVGKLFLRAGSATLFSFAHGERSYKLLRQLHEIVVRKGKARETADATLEILRDLPDVFDLGGALVIVDKGRSYPLDQSGLSYYLGGVVQYVRLEEVSPGRFEKSPVDPPLPVIKQLLSLIERRRLKPLKAVITAPTIRPNGTVLVRAGYDHETGLYLECEDCDASAIIENPNSRQVRAALRDLLKPFEEFPFVTPDDRGVFLAALLTAIVRPVLPTSPGFGFDAPVQGSGKTLLANCVAALATGEAPGVFPHAGGNEDEEVRKRVFAALLQGRRVLVWDNVVGTFDSPSVAAVLTSADYTDRILGRSETIAVPNRLLLLMTGNNLSLVGDMARRILTCRIDPRIDRPYAREFDFDPFEYVLGHRQVMVAAGITLLRGWLTSGIQREHGRMASFELWDDLVRQAIIWISKEICPGRFGDPMNAVDLAQAADPENEVLAEMLDAMHELFGTEFFTAGKVLSAVIPWRHSPGGSSADARLAECLREFSDKALFSARSIGRVLKYRVDRVAAGKRLERVRDQHTKANRWRVVTLD